MALGDAASGILASDSATLEKPSDAGPPPSGIVKRWILELGLAKKEESTWAKKADTALKTYSSDDNADSEGKQRKGAFNILWANVETLRPACYNSTPQPDVRRRFRDADPVGKAVSQVLERTLEYSVQAYDFDEVMTAAVLDMLLPGRGVTRVRYLPSVAPMQDKPPEGAEPSEADESDEGNYEEVVAEEVCCEPVEWDDFRRGPGKTWKDVPWVAFRHRLDRDELTEKFGELGRTLELDDAEISEDERRPFQDQELDAFKRALVWEIWDKRKRQVIFIAPSHGREPLKVEPDPLGLDDFFPIPRPLMAVERRNSLIPICEYAQYQSQAEEMNRLTRRISSITDAIRVRGIYDATIAELEQVFGSEDNELIPAKNVLALSEGGGLEKFIWWLPVEQLARVLAELLKQREACKQTIYELTGIADIMRGSTDAGETASAQRIKTQWGTLRLQRKQREVQRYARDLLRLKAEIIAKKFGQDTLADMSNLEFPTAMQKMQAQQMQAMAQQQPPQQPGQPPAPPPQLPPGLQELLAKPTWEEILGLMRRDPMRQFKVDVETDSTIAMVAQEDKADVTELLGGVVQYLSGIAPAVQSGALPIEAAKALLMAAVRRFKLGSEVEDELDKLQAPQPGPDPAAAAVQAKAQAEMQAMQARAQLEGQLAQQKSQAEIQESQARAQMQQQTDARQAQDDMQLAQQRMQMEMALKREEMQQRMALEREEMQHRMAIAVSRAQEAASASV